MRGEEGKRSKGPSEDPRVDTRESVSAAARVSLLDSRARGRDTADTVDDFMTIAAGNDERY